MTFPCTHIMYSAHIHLLYSLIFFSPLPSHSHNALVPFTKIVLHEANCQNPM